ncbi:hypothetical protein LTR57_018316 [Friedmanniomyces endolithicus]|nr:hypothetical protein LTR94_016209 [Friedmanniomyces endolithicus]KAK0768483.1 hypothetical protein LTR59_017638 [Friedmanniomyces endolithicus]KAK0787102.1 hypothetical protein LTR38_011763 [Friedmanniomyces endolithicus]KAK0828720.1 hypothetical protein LTR03_016507 [Friedmanniomyces endolithicus]KAK0862763.1 hypothetical protein LTS02_006990 [Friedmanniomyces endolithicus]
MAPCVAMPHKHTRKRNPNATNDYNLAPSTIAKPLAAFSGAAKDGKGKGKFQTKKPSQGGQSKSERTPNLKRKRTSTATTDYKEDDTPRAFARLMQFQTTGKRPSGLDDERASRKAKKRKTAPDTTPSAAKKPEPVPTPKPAVPATDLSTVPKILPGERLADYSARVDQALPVSGLARKGKHARVEGVKERVTKTEKRLKKMYAAWREEDVRRKEKAEEVQEEEEEAEEERRAKWAEGYRASLVTSTRRGKKQKVIGEADGSDDDGDADPWAVLNSRREKPKGLHDVVLAPPTLKVVPKEKFKVREGARVQVADVPAAAGSLKRREELGEARRDVIERYREIMRGGGGL